MQSCQLFYFLGRFNILFDDNLLALVQVDALGGGLAVQAAATDGVPPVVDVALACCINLADA